MNMKSSHVLLMDIDGTLTPARKPVEKQMAYFLERLTIPFFVAAGSDLHLLENQFFLPLKKFGFKRDFEAFLNNGTTHYECIYTKKYEIVMKEQFDIKNYLGDKYYKILLDTIKQVNDNKEFILDESMLIEGERIIDRHGMINFTPMGRSISKETLSNEEIEKRSKFVEFDRRNSYRKRVKAYLEQQCHEIIKKRDLLILIGGQTSFDIVIKGKDKSNAVRDLLKRDGIKKITFLGDALFDGGNDSVIMDFIQSWDDKSPCPLNAISVDNWEETIEVFHNNNWI